MRRRQRVAAALGAVAGLLAATLTGCAGERPPRGPAGRDGPGVARMLDARAAAVRGRDADAFLATVDRAGTAFRAAQRRTFANLAAVPLRSFSYRLVRTGEFPPALGGGRRLAATVELGYRLAGYDTAPVTARQYLTLVSRAGRWYVASDTGRPPGGRPPRQLWDQGPVTVVRGAHSLVLGVLGGGRDEAALRRVAAAADRAVPAVGAVWPDRWARRVVVEVPASLDGMAALLGAAPGDFRDIAAVTTGELGSRGPVPADRVIVNPEAYDLLGDTGRQVVLTHETAHVATRPVTDDSTPLWLSEGYADWAGYLGSGRTARQAAPELAAAVAAGDVPRGLPSDADFRFGAGPATLARAYEGGWLACRMIADRWGADRLAAFYRAVGRAREPGPAVRDALRRVLGTDPAAFTARWRAYLTDQLR
ncbi:hypothetical protein RKE29_20780 [Streptomyces sp. B1866]|uniref:hypothetical protein n=1 Tax=Streptomyces sp. B1866 TaxID=3075431 RepID=UPI00288FCBD3|nr:hypothetical protein [Streptomyces sp. B1866]MDT3399050.1 hypothetical protein [Streptomyces sp. B1866]